MRRVDQLSGSVLPGPSDARVAAVLERLGPDDLRALLAFPPDGAAIGPASAGMEEAIRGLLDLELVDPEGLVSFRVQLVEPCSGGLRLSRLGRAAVSAVWNAG